MRITGWCEKCHKVKTVRVSSAGMAMLTRGTPTGVCDSCQEKEDERRKRRR